MNRLLVSLFLALSLIAAPVLASVCVDDCPGAIVHQHEGVGEKTSDKGGQGSGALFHCCHVNVAAMTAKDVRVIMTSTAPEVPLGHDSDPAGRNPSPLLKPPSHG